MREQNLLGLRQHPGLWIAYASCAVAMVCAAAFGVGNPDTFGHLALGREIAALGHVPTLDSFSFWKPTAQPFINYEWLSGLLFWWSFDAGGYNGLLALKLTVLVVLAGLLVRLAAERRGSEAAALTTWLVVLALPAVRFRLTERPHLFGLALAAFLLLALRRIASVEPGHTAAGTVRRWTVGIAVLHVLWVNLHGSNLLGLALTTIHLASFWQAPVARARLLRVVGLQLAASCVSPFGPFILVDAIAHVANPEYRQLVSEWAPWDSDSPALWAAAIATQTVLLALCLLPLRRAGLQGKASLACLVLFALMAARSLRFIDDYLLLGAPLIAEGLALRLEGVPVRRLLAGVYASLPLCGWFAVHAATGMPPFQPLGYGLWPTVLPVVSGDWLHENRPQARILTAMPEAFYLMFATPRAHFFHDGRVPFYGPEHTRLAASALGSVATFRDVVARFGIDSVVVHHSLAGERALLTELRASEDFALVAIEDRHALYVRKTPTAPVVKRTDVYRSLIAGYEPAALLAPSAAVHDIERELARMPHVANTSAYRAWVQALLALRPFARSADQAGFRAASNGGERAVFSQAFGRLRLAADRVADVPILYAYAASAGINACDLSEAASYLALARKGGDSRDTLLLTQELKLRFGARAEVERFLIEAQALPQAEGDVWLEALRKELKIDLRCSR